MMISADNSSRYRGQAVVAVTYDDGRSNNYSLALPLHEKWGVTATFAIIAGRVLNPAEWRRFMTPWQVADASRRGVEIASHGYLHKRPFTDLGEDELALELQQSRRVLEGIVPSGCVQSLCVPYSRTDSRVLEAAFAHYKVVRVRKDKYGVSRSAGVLVTSFGIQKSTTIDEIRMLLERAISERLVVTLMLHGVEEADQAVGDYNVTAAWLDGVLGLIAGYGEDRILPVSLSDLARIEAASGDATAAVSKDRAGKVKAPSSALQKGVVLKEHDDFMLTYYEGTERPEKLVISFGGLPSRKTKSGFGTGFIRSQGWSHVFVAQRELSQYQGLSIEEFRSVLDTVMDGRDVYTYGSSLGGYCAIYYGGCVDAQIISAAPKNSAHPSMRKARFSHVDFVHHEIRDVPRSGKPPVVVYDPYRREETDFIENLVAPAYPDVRHVRLPFAGHTVLNTMLQSGVLKNFICALIDRDELIQPEIMKEGSSIWHAEVGRHLLGEGDLNRARSELDISVRIEPGKENTKYLFQALQKLHDFPGVLALAAHLERAGLAELILQPMVDKARARIGV